MSNAEDVIMLVRSVLASRKGPCSLKELQTDYYECNGENVPFRRLGFNTLVDFIQSIPDKFRITFDSLKTCYIQAVIDSNMSGLSRLVAGQKSKRKKKKAPTQSYYRPLQTRSSFLMNSYNRGSSSGTTSYKAPFNFATKSYFTPTPTPTKPAYSAHNSNSFLNKPTYFDTSQKPAFNNNNNTINNKLTPTKTIENDYYMRSLVDLKSMSIRDDEENVLSSLRIENAAYFLKEHLVLVSHVESVQVVFIRLVAENFSVKLNRLFKDMDDFYKQQSADTYRLLANDLHADMVCVGLDTESGHFKRLQLKDKDDDQVLAFCVDYGATEVFKVADLYEIKDEFLTLKFQAIKVRLSKLDAIENNECAADKARAFFEGKEFTAKRDTNTTLTVTLYDKTGKNMNEAFVDDMKHLTSSSSSPKLEKVSVCAKGDTLTDRCISYIDEETGLVYLMMPIKDGYEELYDEVRKYCAANYEIKTQLVDNRILNKHGLTEDTWRRNTDALYMAKWIDDTWYRVRVLRFSSSSTVLVHFVDYGNRELIELPEIQNVAARFAEFFSIPYQSFPVHVEADSLKRFDLKACLFECHTITAEVIHLNPTGTPTVKIVSVSETPIQTANASEDEDEEEDEDDESSEDETKQGEVKQEKPVAATSTTTTTTTVTTTSSLAKTSKERATPPSREDVRVVVMANDTSPEGDNRVKIVNFGPLSENSLSIDSIVYVSSANTPSDFVINLESSKKQFDLLLDEMRAFYTEKAEEFKINSLEENTVYVHKNEQKNTYSRVRFIGILGDRKNIKVHDIDMGNFDVVKLESLYHVPEKFLTLKPMALKAHLANVMYDRPDVEKWSEATKRRFHEIVGSRRLFRAKIVHFEFSKNSFKLELFDTTTNQSVSAMLIQQQQQQQQQLAK